MIKSALAKKLLSPAMLKAAVLPAAIVLGGALVMHGSTAAFTGTTQAGGDNTWKAATVALSNDHASVLFSANSLKPGTAEQHCVTVTSASDVATTLRMYSSGFTGSTDMTDNLTLMLDAGSGGTESGSGCTGFTSSSTLYSGTMTDFAANNTNFLTGVGNDVVAAGGSQQYRIFVQMKASAPNTLQGQTVTGNFVWGNM